jgi:hypothetical protein
MRKDSTFGNNEVLELSARYGSMGERCLVLTFGCMATEHGFQPPREAWCVLATHHLNKA